VSPNNPAQIPGSTRQEHQPVSQSDAPTPQSPSPTLGADNNAVQLRRSAAETQALAKKIAIGLVILVPTLFILGLVLIMTHYHGTKTVDKSNPKNIIPTSLGTKKTIGHKIRTDLGYDITVDEVVTGFRAPYVTEGIEPYFIKVTIAEPTRPTYLDTEPYPGDFELIVNGQELDQYSYDDHITDTDLKKAGYAPLESRSITPTTPNSGYIQVGVPKGKTPTALRYKQRKFQILGEGGSIPAKDYDIPLR